MRKIIFLTMLMLNVLSGASAATTEKDYMTTESITVAQGDVVPVNLYLKKSTVNACAWQCDVKLPKGITLADNGVTKAARCADSHLVKYNILEDGTVRIICYSMNNDTFKDDEGAIATFNINISSTMPLGTSDILVHNTVLADVESKGAEDEAGKTSQITTVTNVKGDVNLDEDVNISDVNAVISVICGTGTAYRSDVNKDNITNISDVNAVISIMCGN